MCQKQLINGETCLVYYQHYRSRPALDAIDGVYRALTSATKVKKNRLGYTSSIVDKDEHAVRMLCRMFLLSQDSIKMYQGHLMQRYTRTSDWYPGEHGGITFCIIYSLEKGKYIGTGISYCSMSDQFCYKTGRQIAYDKAIESMESKDEQESEAEPVQVLQE